MVNVGIFWVIYERIWHKKQEKEIRNGKIDSDFAHYLVWENSPLKEKYKESDFATFPRGRVIYDSEKMEHIIYADGCISKERLLKIAELFCIEKYRIEGDLHYRCDNCLNKWFDIIACLWYISN